MVCERPACFPAAASTGTRNLHSKVKTDTPGNLRKELKMKLCGAEIEHKKKKKGESKQILGMGYWEEQEVAKSLSSQKRKTHT